MKKGFTGERPSWIARMKDRQRQIIIFRRMDMEDARYKPTAREDMAVIYKGRP